MLLHLPKFQHLLHHPDIHLCIIDQIKIIQTQLDTFDNWSLIEDRLNSLQYLCISKETSDVVVQCYKQVFKRDIWTYADLLCVISVKLSEQQLDDVIEFFMGIIDKGEYVHYRCAESIAKIALKLNERQLNKVFKCLMNAFESGKITICKECAHALATISSQLGGKQLDNAFQCLIHRFPLYFYNDDFQTDLIQFLMKLKEEQLGDVFKFLIDGLSDEKENDGVRKKVAELIGKISMKWNEKQLIDAFNSLIDIFNAIDDSYDAFNAVREAIAEITVKLPGRQFDNAFNYLISRLNSRNNAYYLFIRLHKDWMKNK
ncbi:hypothetical protein RFI_36148 [Reticulomyxa filosa]|uniref:Uncharacterized protein n=1 Tax=Reticulomyxa filosa TaxID=46433 RepID=X6LJH5_RETFI|nr:hypothetical protein RFI_36148 [Reticulomyxa filosa]|eukprot:ETO01292.1 hypothetical protein RFI_36148 [Reticulomyxa filosa]